MSLKKYSILYIKTGHVPPPQDKLKDEFYYLSNYFSGHILNPVWDTDFTSTLKRESFTYHLIKTYKLPKALRFIIELYFYIFKALQLYYLKSEKFDAVVSFGVNKCGFAAFIISILTRTKLVIDVPGNPARYFISHEKCPSISSKIKNAISKFLFKEVIKRADMVKLLYPTQLDEFPSLKNVPRRVFFACTPLEHINTENIKDDNFIFFLGSPWYLKGVDILIKAFKKISSEFPEISLKIAGYTNDFDYFKFLAEDNKKIELITPGMQNEEALKIFSRCTFFVLPSRTEAMGKVLLEAMFFKKAVIGSNIDGIPTIVKDGYNGLLFEPNNENDLAEKMLKLLRDLELRKKLGENGKKFVSEETTNKKYVELFYEMISSTIKSQYS